MTKKTQETGRSLVETLSVLAIMGLLSIGSLTGYKLAMNKHRANELLNDLMKRATVISAQRQSGQTPEDIEGETIGGYPGYTVEGIATPNSEQFAITVEDVPQEVCEKIVALDLQNATISLAECPDEKNEMTFTYNNDLSPITDSNAGGSTGGNEGDESEEDTTPVCDAEHLELCENISDCEEKANGKWCDGTSTCISSGDVCQPVCDAEHLDLCENSSDCEEKAQGKWCDDTSTCISSGDVCQPVCDAEHLNLCENSSDCEEKANGKWCDGTSTCISGGVCQCSTEPNVCQKCDETGAIIADAAKNGAECATGQHCFDGNCSSFVGYCRRTDSNAECIEWDECEEGKVHTGNEILNIPNAEATCSKAERIYCLYANSDGNCIEWRTCPAGRAHSGREVIGVPNGLGICAEEGASVYCYEFYPWANKCGVWGSCSGTAVDATSSNIIGGECLE